MRRVGGVSEPCRCPRSSRLSCLLIVVGFRLGNELLHNPSLLLPDLLGCLYLHHLAGGVFLAAAIDHNTYNGFSVTAYTFARDGVTLGGANGLSVCSGGTLVGLLAWGRRWTFACVIL